VRRRDEDQRESLVEGWRSARDGLAMMMPVDLPLRFDLRSRWEMKMGLQPLARQNLGVG